MSAVKKVVISKDWLTADPKTTRVRKIHKFEQMKVMRSEDLPDLMTTQEAADFLGRHYKTVEEYRKDNSLKFYKIRGRYFTTPEYLTEFIEAENRKK